MLPAYLEQVFKYLHVFFKILIKVGFSPVQFIPKGTYDIESSVFLNTLTNTGQSALQSHGYHF